MESEAAITAGPDAATSAPPSDEGDKARALSAGQLMALLPQFDQIELIGRGGMGMVFKARQKNLDRRVALKVLSPEAAAAAGFAERFAREARAMARLNHPNIVAIYDFGCVQHAGSELCYLTMEFVDGSNLRALLKQLLPMQALAIIPQICEALQYAHNIGIIHRDIKPENILVDTLGRVKIADFGLAKLLEQARSPSDYTLTRPDLVMGTPSYMAPEQLERPNEVDHRADLYSLGVVFYEMLTGQLPKGRFALPSQKVQIDVRLDEVVLKALEHDRELRYQQASEVRTSVETVRGSPPQLSPVHPRPPAVELPIAPPQAGKSEGVPRFPLALKVLAATSALTVAVAIVCYLTHAADITTVLIIGAALGLTFAPANQFHAQKQIRRARELGLWPALGEVPTIEHVNRLAQAGEMILAIKLCRQMGAGLAEAKAIAEKFRASEQLQSAQATPTGATPREPARFYGEAFALYCVAWTAFLFLWNLGWPGFMASVCIFAVIAWLQARYLQKFRPEIVAGREAQPRWMKALRPSNINAAFTLAFLLILLGIGFAGDTFDNPDVAKIFSATPALTDTSRDFLKNFQGIDSKSLNADVRDLTLGSDFTSYPIGLGSPDKLPPLRTLLIPAHPSGAQWAGIMARMIFYPAAIRRNSGSCPVSGCSRWPAFFSS
jgi:serine/threonine protein kinase